MVSTYTAPAPHEATRNSCRLCAPLGASIAFSGIARCVPYLHGGQGCATYIRRYTISHFREPVDIASSSFGETATVFGGKANLFAGLKNVIKQYQPDMIGIASTCLSETIGENVAAHIKEFRNTADCKVPELVFASTPSYNGSHYDGFHRAVFATLNYLAEGGPSGAQINILPNLISPADIRHLKEITADFGLEAVLLPDYSDTLDGVSWSYYHPLPQGGTSVQQIRTMGRAAATFEFSHVLAAERSAGAYLASNFGVSLHRIGIPVGVTAVDSFLHLCEQYSGRVMPEKYAGQRGRLLDAYVDGHKYVFNKKALVYGDPDFVLSLGAFLAEIGMVPVLCCADKEKNLQELGGLYLQKAPEWQAYDGLDFMAVEEIANQFQPDILLGSSKGYPLARRLKRPLVRLGFPVHDRLGATRLRSVGYAGTQELFDRIVNALLEHQQDESSIGFAYM